MSLLHSGALSPWKAMLGAKTAPSPMPVSHVNVSMSFCRNLILDAAQVVAETIREVAASTTSRPNNKRGPEKLPARDIRLLRTIPPVEISPDMNIPVPVKCVIDAL